MPKASLAGRDRFLQKHPHPKVLTPRACYVCSGSNFESISEYDRYGIPYPVGICTQCGNVQQTKYYTPDVLGDFYQVYYRDIYGSLPPSALFKVSFDRDIFEFFDGTVSPTDRVLEIGTGSGGNLLKFKNHGCDVLGLDFDPRYLDEGRKHGLRMEFGSLDALDQDAKFDIIILAHVLEHIDGPIEFLQKAITFLAPKGRLYIEVPSLDNVSEGGYNYDVLRYFQNAHTIHFTTHSFKNVCVSSGLKIVKSDTFIRSVLERDASSNNDIAYHYDETVSLLECITAKKNSTLEKTKRKLRSLRRAAIDTLGLRGLLERVRSR